jgi:hypothetical protein
MAAEPRTGLRLEPATLGTDAGPVGAADLAVLHVREVASA